MRVPLALWGCLRCRDLSGLQPEDSGEEHGVSPETGRVLHQGSILLGQEEGMRGLGKLSVFVFSSRQGPGLLATCPQNAKRILERL